MKPDAKTKAIIQKCIDEKWQPIVDGKKRDEGCTDCELCHNFMCAECPFFLHGCKTSYLEWDYWQEANGDYWVFDAESKQLALNVLNDLKELLK